MRMREVFTAFFNRPRLALSAKGYLTRLLNVHIFQTSGHRLVKMKSDGVAQNARRNAFAETPLTVSSL